MLRVYVPSREAVAELELRGRPGVDVVAVDEYDDHTVLEIVAPSELAEAIVSLLENRHGGYEGFRILIWELTSQVPASDAGEHVRAGDSPRSAPVNVEELRQRVASEAQLDWVYVFSIAIAAVVAAAGLFRDSTELIVASMILAPLLAPSMALSVATALGDLELGKRALVVNGVGIGVALLGGAAMGAIFDLSLDTHHVASRTSVGLLDFVVAGTAGAAGAFSYTSGAFGRIVGVMIAVALLPPMVLTGMLLGAFKFSWAVGPGLLSLVNLICINLAGVVVLFIQTVRPRHVYEKATARRAVMISVAIWVTTLAALIVIVALAGDKLAGP